MARSIWQPVGDGEWVGNDASQRWDVYTRGNAGEVYPEVFTPLSFSLAAASGEQAMRNALMASGLVRAEELDGIPLSTSVGSGVFGGYAYLNLSMLRMVSARAPGGKAADADVNYLGAGDPPPHVPVPGERNLRATMAGLRYVIGIVRNPDLSELDDDRQRVDRYLESLPPAATATDAEIRAVTRSIVPLFADLFETHLRVSFAAGIMLSILTGLCESSLDDPDAAVQLLAGIGDVDSAAPSTALWDLGRLVRENDELSSLFETNDDEPLWPALQRHPRATTFVSAFEDFLARYGSRGPNEWDTAFDTWETDPEMALTLVGRMRLAHESHNPRTQQERLAGEAARLEAEARSKLRPPVRGIFSKVLAAARTYSQGRERAKTTVVQAIHGARILSQELDRRLVERAGGTRGDLWFVVDDELDDYIADPSQFGAMIARRRSMHRELECRVPPFFFAGSQPPLEEWEPRNAPREAVHEGEVLEGLPGCLGVARGRARVVTDPARPGDLQPGDILVAPITDPSWTPLFVPADGVVVDVGAVMSHAVIVSRELGIPCVVSATDATRRIPDGALIEVDGNTGTVTVIELP